MSNCLVQTLWFHFQQLVCWQQVLFAFTNHCSDNIGFDHTICSLASPHRSACVQQHQPMPSSSEVLRQFVFSLETDKPRNFSGTFFYSVFRFCLKYLSSEDRDLANFIIIKIMCRSYFNNSRDKSLSTYSSAVQERFVRQFGSRTCLPINSISFIFRMDTPNIAQHGLRSLSSPLPDTPQHQ